MNPLSALLIISGSIFSFIAALGVIRFSCFYTKVQAASKASTLGVILIYIGLAIESGSSSVVTTAIFIVIFMMLTVPTGTHALVKAFYKKESKSKTKL